MGWVFLNIFISLVLILPEKDDRNRIPSFLGDHQSNYLAMKESPSLVAFLWSAELANFTQGS